MSHHTTYKLSHLDVFTKINIFKSVQSKINFHSFKEKKNTKTRVPVCAYVVNVACIVKGKDT